MVMLKKSVWILFGVVLALLIVGGLQIVTPTWLLAIAVLGIVLVIALFAWWEENLFALGAITWYFLALAMTSYTFNYTFTSVNTCKIPTDCFSYTIAGPTWAPELFGWFTPFLDTSNFLIITGIASAGLVFLVGFLIWKRSQQHISHLAMTKAVRTKEWLLLGGFIASIVLMYPILIINYSLPESGMQSDAYVSWIAIGLFGIVNLFQLVLLFWLLRVSWQAKDWRFLTMSLTWFAGILFILTTTAALVVNPNNPLMNFGSTLFSFAMLFANAPLNAIPLAMSKVGLLANASGISLVIFPYLFICLLLYLTREKIRKQLAVDAQPLSGK